MPRAQSADGAIHEFPDGTDPAVIDRVMKDYATGRAPQASPAQTSGDPPSPLLSYLRESLGALSGAGPEIVRGAKDIGQALVPGMDPRPGFNRVGDIAQFLTGGLTSPLGAEGRTVDPVTKIGEARNLAREMGAPGKIEKLEQRAAKPSASVPFGGHAADYLGVMEAAARGDMKWLTLSLGRKAAETVIGWARSPTRTIEDLQKFLVVRRQVRTEDMQKFVDATAGPALRICKSSSSNTANRLPHKTQRPSSSRLRWRLRASVSRTMR
jgi:hypothetical protein